MMTRKDYALIANAIALTRGSLYQDEQLAIDMLVDRLAADLKEDNPRFDHDKFVEACERINP